MTARTTFLKQQAKILDKYDIPYYSADFTTTWDSNKKRVVKGDDFNLPSYEDVKINKYFNTNKKSLVLFTGGVYNLICIDIDNKEYTLENWENFVKENEIDLETLTEKSMNGGFHY